MQAKRPTCNVIKPSQQLLMEWAVQFGLLRFNDKGELVGGESYESLYKRRMRYNHRLGDMSFLESPAPGHPRKRGAPRIDRQLERLKIKIIDRAILYLERRERRKRNEPDPPDVIVRPHRAVIYAGAPNLA